MNRATDQELLGAYAAKRSEAAFAQLVQRYLDFVYAAALRTVRDPHLAHDVTQTVFIALAQNAGPLMDCAMLAGWLHRTTRNLAANAIRSDVRRRAREQEAVAMHEFAPSDARWEQIAPDLDPAIGELRDSDRDVLLLRYFQGKSVREIAEAFRTSEEAAQKRILRAVNRLRELLVKRGITVGAGGLSAVLSAHAIHAAPAGLGSTIAAAAGLAGFVQPSTVVAATKAMVMTTLQKTLIGATCVATLGTGVYQTHQATRLRTELHSLQRDQVDQQQRLEQERAARTAAEQALFAAQTQAASNLAALAALRGEMTRLRTQPPRTGPGTTAQFQADPPVGKGTPPAETDLPKDAWADAGFGTPQAALRTRGWSVLNGHRERFKESVFITEGARRILEDLFVQMAERSNHPDKAQFIEHILKEQLGVEEGLLMPMMAENRQKAYLGYRILSQLSPSDGEAILQVETTLASAPAKTETLKFRRFGNDWKVVIDEEFVRTAR